jgi:hypothetical protein
MRPQTFSDHETDGVTEESNVHHLNVRHPALLLGAFAKLSEAIISSVMSVRLSARMEQLGSHWTDFDET